MASPTKQLKPSISVEHIDMLDKSRDAVELDKFGAATTKGAEELALVKKLDYRMMVRGNGRKHSACR